MVNLTKFSLCVKEEEKDEKVKNTTSKVQK